MQYYSQPTQYPYPVQQPQAYPAQQYVQPLYYPPQPTPEEQRKNTYRRLLRKNANSIGTLLLIFFGAELLFSVVLAFLTLALGIREDSSSGEFFLLENGAISMVVFFLVGIIYCLIRVCVFPRSFPLKRYAADYWHSCV